jgi:hypothetical protein
MILYLATDANSDRRRHAASPRKGSTLGSSVRPFGGLFSRRSRWRTAPSVLRAAGLIRTSVRAGLDYAHVDWDSSRAGDGGLGGSRRGHRRLLRLNRPEGHEGRISSLVINRFGLHRLDAREWRSRLPRRGGRLATRGFFTSLQSLGLHRDPHVVADSCFTEPPIGPAGPRRGSLEGRDRWR